MTRDEMLRIKWLRPILFNTEMILRILDGSKGITRRIIDRRILDYCCSIQDNGVPNVQRMYENAVYIVRDFCPYQPLDILYVRETWSETPAGYVYRADGNKKDHLGNRIIWHPSIHMPKAAARIFLKVTESRIERLQDISGQDVLLEGINSFVHPEADYFDMNQREAFEAFWNSTIRKSDLDSKGWAANPWVWVIRFEKIDVDEFTWELYYKNRVVEDTAKGIAMKLLIEKTNK
mgnify:CR=1 FL=1